MSDVISFSNKATCMGGVMTDLIPMVCLVLNHNDQSILNKLGMSSAKLRLGGCFEYNTFSGAQIKT